MAISGIWLPSLCLQQEQLCALILGNFKFSFPIKYALKAPVFFSFFSSYCAGGSNDQDCFERSHLSVNGTHFKFSRLHDFESRCLTCNGHDYSQGTFIFNTFVFCQIFNEFNARSIKDDVNVFAGLETNPVFFAIIFISVGLQILMVELGGEFVHTSGLSPINWVYSCLLGSITLGVGILMRFIPVEEDPDSFVNHQLPEFNESNSSSSSASLSIEQGSKDATTAL
jgi:hypothetical protein